MIINYQSEADFLGHYDASVFDKPSTSVDMAIFTILEGCLHVLTVARADHPFKRMWALVGGFIDLKKDPDIESTAKRKLEEKTGVKTPYLEQLGTIGNNTRDPRGWSVTTVYFALIPAQNIELYAADSSGAIKWSKVMNGKVDDVLAFDHAEILERCVERLRSKVLYTSLPLYFMSKGFTLGELQKVYEIILGRPLEHKSFRRRLLSVDLLEETGMFRHEGKRPARLYHVKKGHSTHFFVRNIEGPFTGNV